MDTMISKKTEFIYDCVMFRRRSRVEFRGGVNMPYHSQGIYNLGSACTYITCYNIIRNEVLSTGTPRRCRTLDPLLPFLFVRGADLEAFVWTFDNKEVSLSFFVWQRLKKGNPWVSLAHLFFFFNTGLVELSPPHSSDGPV